MHFHPDDLADVGWETTFTWTVPEGTPSGIYAAEVLSPERDLLWFTVRPGPERARLVLLLPTMTYLAYANNHLPYPDVKDRGDGFVRRSDPRQQYVYDHPELGRSLYDVHSDGSGISVVSFRRPMVDNRPDFVTDFLSSGRHLAADLYLVDWLSEMGFDFDVVTDHDLHVGGVELIEPYDVVITGSHPEYVSAQILDALSAFGARGGNLMYLGGNGFYWATSIGGEGNHLMEVRRGTTSNGIWRSRPGEVNHALTGEPGGNWRFLGRSEHELGLVGYAAAGSGSRPMAYVRTAASHTPGLEYLFQGIREDVIGDFGYALGAAAGDEIDRFDCTKGSPEDAVVLASARGFNPADYAIIVEDFNQRPDVACHDELVRADIAIALREDRGSVFAVGSISWTASLAHNNYDNNVSTLTSNVLKHFLERRRPRGSMVESQQ